MQPTEPTDAELVAQTLAGNREAFGDLYDRYARLVRSVICGVTWDWPMVQDLTQESFLRAYRKLGSLREPARFGAWVAGIARQVARERRRSLRRDRHEFGGQRPLEVESRSRAIEVEAAEEWEFVRQKMAALGEREQLAIHSFFLQERNAARTAELLNVSRSGLYALLGRALERLAALVDPCGADREDK